MNEKTRSLNAIVIEIIRAARKVKSVKQSEIASAIAMTECNYNKIEKHHKPLSLVQLAAISGILGISPRKIVTLAEALQELDIQASPLQEQIVVLYEKGRYSILDDFRNLDLVAILGLLREIRTAPKKEPDDGKGEVGEPAFTYLRIAE